MKLEQDVALSRFTTIGTGGPARFFARPASLAALQELLGWARGEGVAVEVIGLGSNMLVHDDGVDALVLRLEGELAEVQVGGDVLVAGGGATMQSASIAPATRASAASSCLRSRARSAAGCDERGRLRLDWSDVMIDALVVDADGARGRAPSELGLSYRHSSLSPGQVVAQVRFRLEPRPVVAIRAHVTELLAQRKATQPTTKRTFGSVFKNPSDEQGAGRLIEECGLKGHRIGGAVISARHANFIENEGGATSADAIALMAEARRRVHERFGLELEHEVRFLGPLELPAV